jgi:hypothetical protein
VRTPTLYSPVRVTPGTEVGLVTLLRRSRALRNGIRARIRGSPSLENCWQKRDAEHLYSHIGSKRLSVHVANAECGKPGSLAQGPVRSTAVFHCSTRFQRTQEPQYFLKTKAPESRAAY